MIVHFDADVLVYRAGFAAEHTYWDLTWEPQKDLRFTREFESRKELEEFREKEGIDSLSSSISARVVAEPVEHALFNARSILKTVKEELQADNLILYLSGPTNFRLGIATIRPYKGKRDPDHKPVHASAIKAMLRREYDVVTSDGQEADDDMATAHYAMWLRDPYSTVIATIDKDLDMVPGLHYNFAKKEKYFLDEVEALRKFYEQLLKGDTVDNIQGVPGIGKAKAAKALAGCNNEWAMYDKVKELYVESYGDKADEALLETGRLLWMRRQPNEWWSPPSQGDDIANT